MKLYESQGIVLKNKEYGEGGRLVTLLLPSAGRVTAVAKGVTKPKSRLRPVVQPLTHASFLLYRGESLDTLIQGEVIASFMALRQDLERLSWAQYLAEVTAAFMPEREANNELFDNLLLGLRLLQDQPVRLTGVYVLTHVLRLAGYQPGLGRCLCGRVPSGEIFFGFRAGSILCSVCRPRDPSAVPVSAPAVAAWRYLARSTPAGFLRLKSSPRILAELGEVLEKDLVYQAGQPFRSWPVLLSLGADA
ncbi:MAG: DNA repair protein RecO [Clostridia bacterium]|nr:MAG: DNA repair protein RecO [Clostridia bacterium]